MIFLKNTTTEIQGTTDTIDDIKNQEEGQAKNLPFFYLHFSDCAIL